MPVQSTLPRPSASVAGQILAMPPKWLSMYEDFVAKNAGQVSQIESALRSLTYIIPGKAFHLPAAVAGSFAVCFETLLIPNDAIRTVS
jgi:hypothetical protein